MPTDPDNPVPPTAAYGSRSLGEGAPEGPLGDDTQPLVGLPLAPVPPSTPPPSGPPAPGEMPAYNAENVLPSGPVGRSPHEPKAPREPRPPSDARPDASDGAVPRRHTARRTGLTPLGRVVLPLTLALVSGVALVAAWVHLQEDREASSSQPVASGAVTTGPAVAGSSPAAPASATPTAAPSLSPSATVSAPPVPVASSPAASPSATAAPTVDRSVPVVVLNSTSRTGLAAKVAAQLRREGWKVVSVGNFRGLLAATTIFAEGHADAVATMRGDLPTKDRVRQPFGAMNPSRLVVVLGADYPRS